MHTFSNSNGPAVPGKTFEDPYETFVTSLDIPKHASFNPFRKFLKHTCGNPEVKSEARLVVFDDNGFIINEKKQEDRRNSQNSDFSATPEMLSSKPDGKGSRRLLLIQNLTPDWVKALHDHWNVPLDFFLSHVEYSDWYTLQKIQEHLPVLCSVPPEHLRIQFVVAREIHLDDKTLAALKAQKELGNHAVFNHPFQRQTTDASEWDGFRDDLKRCSGVRAMQDYKIPTDIQEAPSAAVPRIAGGFNPTPAPTNTHHDDPFVKPEQIDTLKPFACVRNTINFWFDHPENPGEWKNAVILFYPPFSAENPLLDHMKESLYRSFLPFQIPPGLDRQEFDSRTSHMESYLFCLRLRDGNIQKEKGRRQATRASKSPFALLDDLLRIIASESLVFDTYAERSLNNIEKFCEILGENCDQRDLHFLLSQLMKIQRRITKYGTLIADAVDAWPERWRGLDRGVHRNYLKNPSPMLDFERIIKLFEHKQARISHAIDVVTSLMGIHQGQLSERRNETLFILTVVTSTLLPFTTVAAIMAIPGEEDLGPNKKHFWKFWISTVILVTGFVVVWIIRKGIKKARDRRERKKLNKALIGLADKPPKTRRMIPKGQEYSWGKTTGKRPGQWNNFLHGFSGTNQLTNKPSTISV